MHSVTKMYLTVLEYCSANIILEPGGYLQWDEADFGNLLVSSPDPEISHAALDDLAKKVHGFLYTVAGTKYE